MTHHHHRHKVRFQQQQNIQFLLANISVVTEHIEMDLVDNVAEASNGSQTGSTDPETSVEQTTAHEHIERTSNNRTVPILQNHLSDF
jgi:hypothetical protein